MRKVFLTIGPQGAGKSMFCKNAVTQHPSIIWISRDEILMRLFGTVWLSRYTGGHEFAFRCMWKIVQRRLRKPEVVLILDCWNGFAEERIHICSELRARGADEIVGLHFITPKNKCVEWRACKAPEKTSLTKENYARDYDLFQQQPVEEKQGFDSIIRIQPELVSDLHFLLGNGEQLHFAGC